MIEKEWIGPICLALLSLACALLVGTQLLITWIVRDWRSRHAEPPIDWRPVTERPLAPRPLGFEEADEPIRPYRNVIEILSRPAEELRENGEKQ